MAFVVRQLVALQTASSANINTKRDSILAPAIEHTTSHSLLPPSALTALVADDESCQCEMASFEWFTLEAQLTHHSPLATPHSQSAHPSVRRHNGSAGCPLPLLVPAHHVELRAHEVRWLGARPMELALEAQQRRGDAAHLERRVVLLALRHRRAAIELARHHDRRRRHVADVHQ